MKYRIRLTNRRYADILKFTFIAAVVISVDQAILGNYGPLVFTFSSGIFVILGLLLSKAWVKYSVKIWGIVLVAFGILRYFIGGILREPDSQFQLEAQISFLFHAVNVMAIGAGVYLISYADKTIHFVRCRFF